MSKATKSNLTEMMAGDGAALSMPPAFVFVNAKSARKYKKANQDMVDGRTKGAKTMLSRIQKRKKMKEDLETTISEAAPTETERAQKQIGQMKKLKRQKQLQTKKDQAKKGMQDKSKEMDILMKARLSDFKKKASSQTKKLQKNEVEHTGDNIMTENAATQDALDVALQVATSELNPSGETDFAKITFSDKSEQNLDNFSAKKIAAAYSQLGDEQQQQYRFMLNKDASTFQSALDFAIRNT